MTTTTYPKSKVRHVVKTVSSTVNQQNFMKNVGQISDMKAHGVEIRKTQQSAIAFLHRAGIVDSHGKLAKPYRS